METNNQPEDQASNVIFNNSDSQYYHEGAITRRKLFENFDFSISNRFKIKDAPINPPSLTELEQQGFKQQLSNSSKEKNKSKNSGDSAIQMRKYDLQDIILNSNNEYQQKIQSQSFSHQKQQLNENQKYKRLVPAFEKKKNHLKIFFLIQKFIFKLKKLIFFQNIFSLSQQQFSIINDQAFGGKHNIKRNQFKKDCLLNIFVNAKYLCTKVCLMTQQIINRIPVIEPDNYILNIFKIILLLFIMLETYVIPFQYSFKGTLTPSQLSYYLLYKLPIIVFILEILIYSNLGYYEQGLTIMNRRQIIVQFMKKKFVNLLIALIALLISAMDQGNSLSLFFLIRIPFIFKLLQEIDENFQLWQKMSTEQTLIKLLVFIFYVAHFCACGFNYIAQIQMIWYNSEDTWIHKLNLISAPKQIIYLNSLYYSFITMITVGYGDITPQTSMEKLYVIIMTLIACGVFAYAVNTIGVIFQEIAKKTDQFKQTKFEVSEYMKSRKICSNTQVKVIKYLEYICQRESEVSQKGEQIVQQLLPKSLREEVQYEFFGKILNQFKIFNLNFSQNFIKQFSQKMYEMTMGPEEILFKQKDLDQRMFFINKGEVEFFMINEVPDKEIRLGSNTEGMFFGQSGLLINKIRDFSARSKDITHLIYCTQQDFIQTLRNFPTDYEKFCQMRDEIIFNGYQIENKCISCQYYGHDILLCPQLHYIIDKVRYKQRISHQSIINDRNSVFRRKKKGLEWHTMVQRNQLAQTLRQKRLSLIGQYDEKDLLNVQNFRPEMFDSDKIFFRKWKIYNNIDQDNSQNCFSDRQRESHSEIESGNHQKQSQSELNNSISEEEDDQKVSKKSSVSQSSIYLEDQQQMQQAFSSAQNLESLSPTKIKKKILFQEKISPLFIKMEDKQEQPLLERSSQRNIQDQQENLVEMNNKQQQQQMSNAHQSMHRFSYLTKRNSILQGNIDLIRLQEFQQEQQMQVQQNDVNKANIVVRNSKIHFSILKSNGLNNQIHNELNPETRDQIDTSFYLFDMQAIKEFNNYYPNHNFSITYKKYKRRMKEKSRYKQKNNYQNQTSQRGQNFDNQQIIKPQLLSANKENQDSQYGFLAPANQTNNNATIALARTENQLQ